jgi:hypothetical protein
VWLAKPSPQGFCIPTTLPILIGASQFKRSDPLSFYFPDPLIEMRNPYAVSLRLFSIQVSDKKGNLRPFYTEEKIEKILAKNFGPDWRERWRQRIFGKSQKA